MKKILEIKDLVVSYGIIEAVKGISLSVEEGTIVALLGANGAGKSTTLRTISGVVKAKSGSIIYDGEDITNKDIYKIAKSGIIASPEGRLILRGLTVEENLRVGAYSLKTKRIEKIGDDGSVRVLKISAKRQMEENLRRVHSYFPVLKERRNQQASTLSGGEQQMVAMGRALMASPKVLLLDEPSLGLAPLIVEQIGEIIREVNRQGTSVMLVEQNAAMALGVAHHGYVVENGRVVKDGPADELRHDKDIQEFYLGVGEAGRKSFRDVKTYRRRKRWSA